MCIERKIRVNPMTNFPYFKKLLAKRLQQTQELSQNESHTHIKPDGIYHIVEHMYLYLPTSNAVVVLFLHCNHHS